MVSKRGVVSASVLAAVCVLTGCGDSGGGVAQDTWLGLPDGLVVEPLSEGPAAAWIERGETFAIVTWGSGSCPPVATDITADGADRVSVTFGSSPNDPCTADMAPTTHEFTLPDGVTDTSVTVEISYEDWPETETLELE